MSYWFEVYSDTIANNRMDNNISMIEVTENCAEMYRQTYLPKRSMVEFVSYATAEETTLLFDFAMKYNGLLGVMWDDHRTLDEMYDDDYYLYFTKETVNEISRVPEEIVPEKLADFIWDKVGEMGFVEYEYADEDGWTKEDFDEIQRFINNNPVLKTYIAVDNGDAALTTYINTAGVINWNR